MVSVLLADNHTGVRDGMRRLLADDTRIQVDGVACDYSEAISKARMIKPDVLILDLHMPFEPNLTIDELRVRLNACGAAILGISFAHDDDARSLATQLGAAELLDKTELSKVLIPAILRLAYELNCLRQSHLLNQNNVSPC